LEERPAETDEFYKRTLESEITGSLKNFTLNVLTGDLYEQIYHIHVTVYLTGNPLLVLVIMLLEIFLPNAALSGPAGRLEPWRRSKGSGS
jgi:hypothetical protein